MGNKAVALVNLKRGGVRGVALDGIWYFHPTEDSVDAAVYPFEIPAEFDVLSNASDLTLNPSTMKTMRMGVGDEVFLAGLFSLAPGIHRNSPMVRQGTIAMIPEEPIQINRGFAEVYLLEMRSIGGISGSPIYLRKTVSISGKDASGKEESLHGIAGTYHLLGLMHGHWEIDEKDLNDPALRHLEQRGVNVGIAIAVPAHKIMEVINHPDLVAARKKIDDSILISITPTED